MDGRQCFRCRASALPALRRRNTPLPDQVGVGTLPDGVTEYKSPTNMVWIIGRIYCTGTPADYAVVHSLQDRFSAAPLGSFPMRRGHNPPPNQVDPHINMKTPVPDQVNAMDTNSYFGYMAQLMQN